MKRFTLVLMLGLVFTAGAVNCGARIPPVGQVPQQVENVDTDVRAGVAKAKLLLTSVAKLMDTLSEAENLAAKDGTIPAAQDAYADKIFLAYANASLEAMKKINTGLKTWTELKATLDTVLAQVNRITEWANTIAAIRDRITSWATAVKQIFMDGLREINPAWAEAAGAGGVR